MQPETYANRLANDLTGRQVILIDPMLATGGTLRGSLDYAFERGSESATCICLLGAPEGVGAVRDHLIETWPESVVSVYIAAIDERLDAIGFIVPSLGDAGERPYGAA